MFIVLAVGCKGRINIANEPFLDHINILDYGAIPNDNKDDSKAIQAAIDFAVKSNKSSLVYCPPGIYDLDNGVVIANQKKSGEYGFITLTLTGPISTYSGSQSIGSTTVFRSKTKEFVVAVQLARQCVIENIVFEGSAKLSRMTKDIIERDKTKLKQNTSISVTEFAPSCAIAIDPFHKDVPINSRYLNDSKLYSNNNRGGTSMLIIKGCTFMNHYIAIANNPSGNIANGDNIKAIDTNVENVHTFWSAGQTQSRANSIENLYGKFIHTFVSGNQIGAQYGTPPTLNNVSLAGFCKQIISMNTGFSGFTANRCYFESLYQLGNANCNFIAFNNCQVKFRLPTLSLPSPEYLLKTNAVASFNDCDIAFFSNCETKMPFTFYALHVNLNGGQIEGGLVLPSVVSNAGGEKLHNITYNNVKMKCYNQVVSEQYKGEILSNCYYKPYVGGALIHDYKNKLYRVQGSTYRLIFNDETKISQLDDSRVSFTSSVPSQYKVGDNLVSSTSYRDNEGQVHRYVLGYVSKIENNRIFIIGCPRMAINKTHRIHKVDFIYILPTFGYSTKMGSSEVVIKGNIEKKIQGMSIKLNGFDRVVRVESLTGNVARVSLKAKKTTTGILPQKLKIFESNSKL